MNIHEYIKQKKELYNALIEFLDSETRDSVDKYKILVNNFQDLKQMKDQEELRSLFHLIIQISHNHKRNDFFNSKIDEIIIYFSDTIKQNLSNSEIFNLFKSNKRILLFLIQSKTIILDEYVIKSLINNQVNRYYFYPELKSEIKEENQQKIFPKKININSFEQNRQNGENDTYLSELIRNDSISEFISFVHQYNLLLSSKLRPSIFEMNPLLNEREPTLIEYTAFYGSIQIFNYLKDNDVTLEPSLWIYIIHSNNAELFYLLEEKQIRPPENSFELCLAEAIKCHHNEIANYIIDNYLFSSDYSSNDAVLESIFRYFNYFYFPENFDQKSIFFYLCQFNHLKLVDFIMKMKEDEFNQKSIFFFLFDLQSFFLI